ncbi:glycoside hydrolase family 9 protein [Dyadobacter sp. CY323]|uniref:glycoside hydrolase family 9 protein n=1 Tax=Dyadobacter sp. CY323 TaxID=2907302 RepID=UPI001F29A8FA|nr:glycoside hydrolase family 9 protein [Dyadobacter sp. CY323]MCE6991743.1 glycoside hydrolase family 9 protein [Dyadobacter sp. CY323]
MLRILKLLLASSLLAHPAMPQNKVLPKGEAEDPASKDKEYGPVLPGVGDRKVVDQKPPEITLSPVSKNVLKLRISERFDTTGCYVPAKYTLHSQDDPDYQNSVTPSKIGRHSHVTGLEQISGAPKIAFELFLIFDKPFKNGDSYQLKTGAFSDLAGNATSVETTFTFSDLVIYDNVKVNQVGYLPDSPKLGKLGNFLGDAWFMPINQVNPPAFQIVNASAEVAFSGVAGYLKSDSSFSGEMVFELDFSSFTTPGTYYIYVPGFGRSHDFKIGADVYDETYYHAARALFFQRSGDLGESNAGIWTRSGLPAVTAEIHSSHNASPLSSPTDYPPGTTIPMQKGWLDAGDYGRYVPTAASALFTLFTAFEIYPLKFPDNHLNIPESNNNIPDLLDELKYETDWLKQMQAPDGGVYFRVTPATWSPGLPGEENSTLFVSEKTTQSTALFAAAMAMAYRNFKPYFPVYANSCLAQAKLAWQFLNAHQTASAPVNVPGISAGPYPDPEDRDNRAWAAAELYKSTGDVVYNEAFQTFYAQIPHQFHATMSWQQHTVKSIWAYSTTTFPTNVAFVSEFKSKLESEVLVNYFNRTMQTHAYHGAYHHFKGYIGYGSFGMAQSYAFDYIMFSHLLGKPELLNLAKIQIDIPLGNNPLSQSFITGIGKNVPKYPLHWSTVPGKFPNPVPGVPVFGPAASLLMNRPSSFAIQDSSNLYPYGFKKEDPYPVLRRYTDARQAVEMSEFTVQEIAVTAAVFAYFSSVTTIPLPVKLKSFQAKSQECNVLLEWETSEEIHADYFSLERSEDGKRFKEIGRQRAIGNIATGQQYSFTDTLAQLHNYYRLKQVDIDGKFEFSRIAFAENPCAGIRVNIHQNKLNVYEVRAHSSVQDQNGILKVFLFNISGMQKKAFDLKQNETLKLNATDLPPGVYIIKIMHGDTPVYTGKIPVF